MLAWTSIAFLVLTLLAEIIGTIGGFGSSVFFVPFANFFFDFHTVLGLTALFHLSSNISKIALFRKGLDKKLILNIGIPSVVFVILGGLLSNVFDGFWLSVFLGVFLIVLGLFFLIKSNYVVPAKPKQSIIGGALSGFSAGLLGTGGAIRGLTMAAFNLEKSVFIATSAVIDLAIDLTRSVVYVSSGYVKSEHLIYIPFLLIIGFCGTFIGQRILTRVSQANFKRFSLLLIVIIGIVSILGSIFNWKF